MSAVKACFVTLLFLAVVYLHANGEGFPWGRSKSEERRVSESRFIANALFQKIYNEKEISAKLEESHIIDIKRLYFSYDVSKALQICKILTTAPEWLNNECIRLKLTPQMHKFTEVTLKAFEKAEHLAKSFGLESESSGKLYIIRKNAARGFYTESEKMWQYIWKFLGLYGDKLYKEMKEKEEKEKRVKELVKELTDVNQRLQEVERTIEERRSSVNELTSMIPGWHSASQASASATGVEASSKSGGAQQPAGEHLVKSHSGQGAH